MVRYASESASVGHAVGTGFATLDGVLPGRGWPVGGLVELLQEGPGQQALGLLAPALARVNAGQQQTVLVGAPVPGLAPFGPALAGAGLAPQRLLWVRADAPHGLAWAAAQALRCRDVAAVLAWLPQARSAQLRQLQVAAHQHHKLLFVVRDACRQHESSPAPLRLLLSVDPAASAALSRLSVTVLKRQGPPLLLPVLLTPGPPRWLAQLAASRSRLLRRRHDAGEALPPVPQPEAALPATLSRQAVHAVDRVAAARG